MSHLTKMEIKALQKNEEQLVEALENHFGKGTVQRHDQAKLLAGYEVDTGGNGKKAHLVISQDVIRKTERTHGYNELGFERTKDGGYACHYDPADIRKPSLDKVMMDYAERVATKTMKAKGYTTKREAQKDGTVKLFFSKYS
jgi:hypothetical protein